ncbi:MAG TPA: MaoC family dehydratase [Blastocatellia bacterium]|jgi:2-methylfumaryl-CoA hydratase
MSDTDKGRSVIEPRYGRLLDDFEIGEIYNHPWEVTIDEGMLAMFAASFLDPNPIYSSRRFARDLGFRDRVIHPMVLMNLALSFSVHDVSEQTIAHLAYIDLKFPNAAYLGDTLGVSSQVLGVRRSESNADRGIVHVRITGVNQDGVTLISFERKALMPVGNLEGRAHPALTEAVNTQSRTTGNLPAPDEARRLGTSHGSTSVGALPKELALQIRSPKWAGRPMGLLEDYHDGDVILHSNGRTVGESEHMQLTMLSRNSHPLHFDEVYSREHSFAGTRVVCGGLVFAWVASLASRDTTANALWEIGYDKGSHPQPVVAGDTLYAASRVVGKHDYNEHAGVVRFHLVGIKNERPARLMAEGKDLFEGRFAQKVFEIERTILIPKRVAGG